MLDMESPLYATHLQTCTLAGPQIHQFSSCQLQLNSTSDRPTLVGFNEWMTDGQFNSSLATTLAEKPLEPTINYLVWGYVAFFCILFIVTFVQTDNVFLPEYRRFFLWPFFSIILSVLLASALCQYDHRKWYERKVAEPIAVELTLERLNDTSRSLLLPDTTWKGGFQWIIRDVSRARALLTQHAWVDIY
ncbi:unnamed protein product [Vitrella brassicaformis CCMP3155]|uniref:Uncharacterized protein n=1 Tax=Vitrella brassicaformis (strain CCMP3155) TaxID=1169540 RepID=A0A0G4FCV9_VITBC|nr:unnamed protein product [Vitrella brassicaformis CCMP3155]|eukprot:CEM11077.1 unnamed protein product [Vitrella brassicaformis CCMP3155]